MFRYMRGWLVASVVIAAVLAIAPAAVACMAVGSIRGVSSGTLAEAWNGTAWSVVPSPSPGTDGVFGGVS